MAGVERRGGSGPEACFDRLYGSHYRALHAYFLGRTNDREAAVDLLQEAFLRAWRNISKLRELSPDRRRYWMYAVARNLLTDYYRGSASLLAVARAASEEAGRSHDNGPEDTLASKERASELEQAIRELPEELRTVLTLRYVGELSSARIGEMLEVPAGTVRYRISVARKRLAEKLRLEPGGV
jgi:RNA polymerase sigma-70 factor (ECF subfamily)